MASQPGEDPRREAMVRAQIERRGVHDPRVLEALRRVPRERFVPADQAEHAYEDRALPIGMGQTISQPYIVAVMTAALRAGDDDRVLEIGTGSGYQAAVLAHLAAHVWSIERHAELAHAARSRLADLGITNVTVIVGDGTAGHPAAAPYDRILVTAGAPRVPGALEAQLAPGGRLVIPVGTAWHQDLQILERTPAGFRSETGDACIFVPLVGRDGWPE
jgi:protein-L-isoaspartate(D-aspartate) O-methyltransferase